jgi:hypothetical protein
MKRRPAAELAHAESRSGIPQALSLLRVGVMLFSFSMTAKLMVAGMVHQSYALLRNDPLHFPFESGTFGRSVLPRRPSAIATASTLRARLDRYKFSVRSHEVRTPACHRRQGDARGNLRDIWEDTRLEAMQQLLEHGSARIDALASPGAQPLLLSALKQLDRPIQQPPAATGEPLLDTVTAPFCAIEYLREKCLEAGISNELPATALESFNNRCDFVNIWRQTPEVYPLTFSGCSLPTMFSIVWDEITRLAKELAIITVFGAPLEAAIQRDLQYLATRYVTHPRLKECCEQLRFQHIQIRGATEPDDLTA